MADQVVRPPRELPPGFRRHYVFAHAFEFFIAVASIISGITYLIDPALLASVSLGKQLPESLVTLWQLLYLAGGIMVAYGIAWLSPRTEVAGLIFFASAISINAIAISTVVGARGAAAIASYVGFALACGARIYVVFGIERIGQQRERGR